MMLFIDFRFVVDVDIDCNITIDTCRYRCVMERKRYKQVESVSEIRLESYLVTNKSDRQQLVANYCIARRHVCSLSVLFLNSIDDDSE